MHKTLVLALLLVFALSGQASSENDPLISILETETISIAATQQVKPVPPTVFPKTDVPRTPAVPKSPTAPKTPGVTTPPSGTATQLNPSLVAVRQMEDAAKQTDRQMRRYQREMAKLTQDPTMMANPSIKGLVIAIYGNKAPNVRGLLVQIEELVRGVTQVLNASGTQ